MKPSKNKLITLFLISLCILLSFVLVDNYRLSKALKSTNSSISKSERFDIIKKDLKKLKKEILSMDSTVVEDSAKKTIIENIDTVIEAMDNYYLNDFDLKLFYLAMEMAYDSNLYMSEKKAYEYWDKFLYMLESFASTGYISSKEYEELYEDYKDVIDSMIFNKKMLDLGVL